MDVLHKPYPLLKILRIGITGLGVAILIFSMLHTTRIPLHQRVLIQGIGIDKTEEQFQVTVQAVSTSASASVEVYQAEGKSLYDALNNLTLVSGKMPFYTHNAIIIIGRQCAEDGLESVIDFFVRHHETRPAEVVFLAKETAAEILTLKTDVQISMNNQQMQLNQYVMASQIQQLASVGDLNSQLMEIQVLDAANDLVGSGDVCLPVLKAEEGEIAADGCAVFRSSTLCALVNKDTTSGIKAIRDSLTGGAVVIPLKDGHSASLSIKNSHCEITSSLRNNVPHFDLQISCSLNINEIDRPLSQKLSSEDFDAMAQSVEKKLTSLTDETLRLLLQEYQVDILYFSDFLLKQQTAWWKQHHQNWREILPQCTYTVTVSAEIVTEGQEMSPQIVP